MAGTAQIGPAKPALHETTRGLLDFPIAIRTMAQNEPVVRGVSAAAAGRELD